MYNKFVLFYRFGWLFRVIIVYLKRYYFNELWVMKKDERFIFVFKYLRLFCYCSKSIKSFLFFRLGEYVKNFDLLKFFEVLGFEIFKLFFNLVRIFRFKGFEIINIILNRELEV